MLWTICVVLLIVWALGKFAPFSPAPVREGNLIHTLLIVLIVLLLFQFLGGSGMHLWRR